MSRLRERIEEFWQWSGYTVETYAEVGYLILKRDKREECDFYGYAEIADEAPESFFVQAVEQGHKYLQPEMRCQIAEMLCRRNCENRAEILTALLSDANENVRNCAWFAIQKTKEQ